MSTKLSHEDAIELLNRKHTSRPTLTSHLDVVKISDDTYQVLNRQGRLVCFVRSSFDQDTGNYISGCSCVVGRKGLFCHHVLKVLERTLF